MCLWIGSIDYGLESNVWNSGLGFGAQGFEHLSEKQPLLNLKKYGGFRKRVRQHLPTIA